MVRKPKYYPNNPKATHYSAHFTRAELECGCGCVTPRVVAVELRKLARGLEQFRKKLGRGVTIVSAYRCKAHNKAVHGAVNSQHIKGTAADLAVPHGHQAEFVSVAKRVLMFRMGGIGVYPNGGVHVDRRGFVARWNSFVGQ